MVHWEDTTRSHAENLQVFNDACLAARKSVGWSVRRSNSIPIPRALASKSSSSRDPAPPSVLASVQAPQGVATTVIPSTARASSAPPPSTRPTWMREAGSGVQHPYFGNTATRGVSWELPLGVDAWIEEFMDSLID